MKVSIAIPVYNVEPYIANCLQSVMRQTYQGPMECILVDDCGTDRSMLIVEQLIEDYEGPIVFRILHHERNRGLAAARNTALEHVTGEFVSHVDSDDWLEDDAIENLVQVQQDTDADIVSGNAFAHYLERIEELVEPEYSDKNAFLLKTIQLSLDHVIWRRLIRTALYRVNGITTVEGVNIGEDHYTLPRLVYYSKSFAKCDKVVYHYNCLNSNSYMQSLRPAFDLRRYRNDRDSIDILIGFFSQQNEPNYVDELLSIKVKYIYKAFFPVIKEGNRLIYSEVCSDWQSIDNTYKIAMGISRGRNQLLTGGYFVNRMRVLGRVFVKKLFGVRRYEL